MIPLHKSALVRNVKERIAAKRAKQRQQGGDDRGLADSGKLRRRRIGPKLAH